jgi:membrane-associated phospholipid phosphatase
MDLCIVSPGLNATIASFLAHNYPPKQKGRREPVKRREPRLERSASYARIESCKCASESGIGAQDGTCFMRNVTIISAPFVLAVLSATAASAASKTIETAGQVVAFGLPVAAGGLSLYKGDDTGLFELGSSWLITVGSAYALSHIVRERRPDGSDYHSFPSDTSASAFSAANYFWMRYGWEWGVPAYALATFAGYSRVQARKHHWYDVATSEAIALGVNYAIVTRYSPSSRYSLSAGASPDGFQARVSYRW